MSMDKKKRTTASNSLGYLVLVIGIIVAVNLIGTRVFKRIDLTDAKVYTLSSASKDIVKKLPDILTVNAYISDSLPPELKSLSRYVRDLLDEYASSSGGKLHFQSVDPGSDKKLEEQASSCGVQKIQVQKLENQKFEVGAYYLGLCLDYGEKHEAVPQIVGAEGLEYQVSSLIKRMTDRKRKLVLTTGHGESDFSQGLQALQQAVNQEFDTSTVNPSSAAIPADTDALLVAGPKQAFDEKGRKEIDKFLMQGKGAIFLVDGMVMSAPRGGPEQMMGGGPKVGQANNTGLDELLKAYGFEVEQDFILDKQSAPGPIDLGGRKMLANQPVFVGTEILQPQDKEKSFTLTAGIPAVIFPFPSSVKLVGPLAGGKPASGKLWRLAHSSKESWKVSGFFFFSPETQKIEETNDKGPFDLAYAYEGPLKSAYPSADAAAGMSAPANGTPSESKKPVRLLVVGDSDFASDEYFQLSRFLPVYGNGAQLLLNGIGWTLEDEALTPVRTKTITSRPIQVDSDKKVLVLKVFNVFGVPLAFCLFGVFRWRVRRARRQGLKL